MATDRRSFATYQLDIAPWISMKRSSEDGFEYYTTTFDLIATNPWGYRRVFGAAYRSEEAALLAFEAEVAPPVDEWDEGNPAYGSWAYQYEGTEELNMHLEREEERLGYAA